MNLQREHRRGEKQKHFIIGKRKKIKECVIKGEGRFSVMIAEMTKQKTSLVSVFKLGIT